MYRFVTPEYAEKNAIKGPWGDILYRNLQPKSKSEAIAQGFYPCIVWGPKLENSDPSSMLWCHEDNLFKRNFQFAKDLAVKNLKEFDLIFNPGPSTPRSDGTREANENMIGPFANFDGLLSHIAAQRAVVEQSAGEADSDDAPSPPKQQKKKKAKASKPSFSAAPKASTKKSENYTAWI